MHDGELIQARSDGVAPRCAFVDLDRRLVAVNVAGSTYTFTVPTPMQRWAPAAERGLAGGDAITAPFPAVEVLATPGQHVAAGETVVVVEAMKMLRPRPPALPARWPTSWSARVWPSTPAPCSSRSAGDPGSSLDAQPQRPHERRARRHLPADRRVRGQGGHFRR